MDQHTRHSGYLFRVGLRGLSYSGHVERVLSQQSRPGRLTVWLALRDVKLTIEQTTITGRPGRADCGPLQILLGNRRPLWVAFDFQQEIEQGRSRLVFLATRFRLPPDNWSIGSPLWVRSSGFAMNRDRVVNGLRNGLARNRQRIEQRLIKTAPLMLAQVSSLAHTIQGQERKTLEAVCSELASRGYLAANN